MQIQEKPKSPSMDESLVSLQGVSWAQFKTVETGLEDVRATRLTYLEGVLEIMSPISDDHETVKSTLGALLEAYMRFKDIRHYRRGGFTLEAEGYASGTPDESYSIGDRGQYPDLVIEVIITSGSIQRTALYLPLNIPEVWFWKSGKLRIFQLKDQQYQETEVSHFFSDLDINLLVKYVRHPDQYDAIRAFMTELES